MNDIPTEGTQTAVNGDFKMQNCKECIVKTKDE